MPMCTKVHQYTKFNHFSPISLSKISLSIKPFFAIDFDYSKFDVDKSHHHLTTKT